MEIDCYCQGARGINIKKEAGGGETNQKAYSFHYDKLQKAKDICGV
jgi:hypothetical protein